MRNVYLLNLMSLDGFFEGPGHNLDWHQVDDEFNDFAIQQLQASDLIVFGRVTYSMMAEYWPTSQAIEDDLEVAKLMNETPKIVFSRTLSLAPWQNTRLVSSDPAQELRRLKQLPGKDIAIFGSAELADVRRFGNGNVLLTYTFPG